MAAINNNNLNNLVLQQQQFGKNNNFNKPVNNIITYQIANTRIQDVLKSTSYPIDAIATWVELFANNEQEDSAIDMSRFKSFMYRLSVEDLVNTNLNGDYSAVQLDPTIALYEPKYIIEKTEVVKSINPKFAPPVQQAEKTMEETSEIREDLNKLTTIVLDLINKISEQQPEIPQQKQSQTEPVVPAKNLVNPARPTVAMDTKN